MKDVLQTYKFNFEFNTKDSKKQLKSISDDVLQMLSDMDSASNKMKVFTNLTGYLEKLDRALNQFKAVHKDDFENMFGGLDAQLSKSLESALGLDSSKLGQLSGLRERIDSAFSSKAGVKELRAIAQDVNSLFASIGEKEPINIDEWFTGKGKNLEQRIGYLNDQLNDFYMSYQLITSSIKGGFGAGGASGFAAMGDEARQAAEQIKLNIKELNSAKKQLESAKDTINKVDKKNSKTPANYKVDLTIESIQGLAAEFDKLNNEIASGDSTSAEYYNNLVKMSEVVIKLKGALKDINADESIKKLFVEAKSGKGDSMFGQLSDYANTKSSNFITQFLGNNISQNIQNIINQNVQDFANLIPSVVGDGLKIGKQTSSVASQYQQLIDKLNEYRAIVEDINFDPDDDAMSDKLFDIKGEIREIFNVSKDAKDAFNNLFDSYDEDAIDFSEFKNGLMNLLNVVEPVEGGLLEAQTTLKEFLSLADTLKDIDYMSEADVDKNITKLEDMKAKLIDLSEQGDITTADLQKINDAFDATEAHLKSMDHSGYEKLQNEADEFGDKAEESAQETAAGLETVESKTHGVTNAFQELINYISKSGSSPKAFFESLSSGAMLLDAELSSILGSLKLIDAEGNVKLSAVGSGSINSGGMISDQYALISRNKSKYLKYAVDSQPKLFEAEKLGANVGTILDIFTDEVNDVMYELQKRVSGVGLNDQDHNLNSLDFLEATDEQIQKLIKDFEILRKVGLYVDHNGKNILYDKNDGFSFIDLASKSTWFTASDDNSLEENLDLFWTSLFGHNPDGDNKNFVQRLYQLAEGVTGRSVTSDYMQLAQSDFIINGASTANIEKEEVAHEQNAAAINAENQALKEQIDLKRKAQSMTWESFALDESLSTAKNAAGVVSLAEQEKFWKKANYDKDVDFHSLSEEDAENIISKYFTMDERDQWYTAQDFSSKSQIENKILSNDELRNAALNKLYHIYKKESGDTGRYANVDDKTGFEDFLNREFEVYRGDTSPVLYGDEQKLSFSFDSFEASRFANYDDKYVNSTKLIPKHTVGSLATEDYEGEQEVFVPSDKLPYLSGVDQSFNDYYNKLGPKMQQAVDNRFVQLEKDRVKSLLGDEVTRRIENAMPYNPELLSQFKQGGYPDKIDLTGSLYTEGVTNDLLAGVYNDLPEIKKKLAAYYASLYSIDPTQQFRSKTIGASGLLDAVVSDPYGAQQHIARLTEESKFNIFGQSADDINSEADAHKNNTSAIQQEEQAQKELNDVKSGYKDVSDRLYGDMNDETWHHGKFNEMANISKNLSDLYDTPESLLAKGDYVSSTTGEVFDISSLIDSINQFEQDWHMNLDYVKDYIQKVADGFKGQKFEDQIKEIDVEIDDDDDFDFGYDDTDGIKYSVQDYEDAYKKQSKEAQVAINDLAEFYQEYEAIQAKIQGDPIDFLISSESPTIEEVQKIKDIFEALQNKIQEINNMQLVETEDDKKKLQELQTEAVGLQNTLRSAMTVGNNSFSYQTTYGLSLADAIKMNGYINGEDIYPVAEDLEYKAIAKRGAVLGSATSDFNDLLFNDTSDSLEEFLLQKAKQLQIEKEITAEQQKQENAADQTKDDNNISTAQQELKTEQNITSEKQEQLVVESNITAEKQQQVALDDVTDNVQDESAHKSDDGSISSPTGGDYALESTLQQTNSILNNISSAVNSAEITTKNVNNTDSSSHSSPPKKKTTSKISPEQKADKAIYETALKQYKGMLNKEMQSLKDFTSLDQGLNEQQQEIADLYNNTIRLIEQYSAAVKKGESVELDSIQNAIAALKEKAKVYKEQNNLTDSGNQKSKSKTSYGQSTMVTTSGKYNALQNKINANEMFANSGALQAKFAEYEASLQRVTNLYNNLKNIDPTEDDKTSFKQASAECNNLAKDVEKLIASYEKLHNDPNKIGEQILDDGFVDSKENRKQALLDYVQSMHGARATIGNFKDAWHGLEYTIDNGDGTFVKAKATIDNLGTAIVETAGDTQKATSKFEQFVGSVGDKFKELWVYTASRFGVDEIIQQIRQGIQYVREIDTALTELKKVTDETDATYNRFLQTASKTASVIGGTVADFTNATADFARLGYNISEATELAKAASVYKNVGDGISDVSQASESIISTMKAFGIEADNAMGIVDRFNEVGNNFAISSTGIGEAMQRSASALFEAGNTIDESIALITGANSVVQNPEQVGTALKTLALRLRGAKVELEEAGEDVDGMAESTSQLQAKLLALTHGKVDIMIDADTFKNTTQILREMSEAWEHMTDIERASALELMGGKRQANILSSVIKNFDTVEDVITTSSNASGSALAENEKYLDSIQGKIDLFTNSTQTMWMNFLNSDAIKWVVDFGSGLIKLIDNVGLLETAFAGFLTYLNMSKKSGLDFASMFGIHDIENGWFAKIKTQATEATNASNTLFSVLQQIKTTPLQQLDTDVEMGQKIDILNQKFCEGQESLAQYVSGLGDTDVALKAYIASVDDGNYSLAGFQNFIRQHNTSVKASGVAAKAAAVGHQLLNAALSMGVSLLASFVIEGIIKGLDELIVTNEELIESAKEAEDAIKSLNEEFKSDAQTVTDYAERFAELAQGVDMLTGKNLSLTTDDYEEFLDLSNQLADIFPTLSRNYDENGNAIVQLSGDTDTMVGSLKSLLEIQRQITNQQIADNLPDLYKGVKLKSNNFNKELTDLEAQKTKYEDKLRFLQNDAANFVNELLTKGSAKVSVGDSLEVSRARKQLLEQLGIDYSTFVNKGFGNIVNGYTYKLKLLFSDEEIEDAKANVASAIDAIATTYSNEINNLSAEIETTTNENKANWNSLSSAIASWLSTDSTYQVLNDDMQSMVQTIVNNLDYTSLDFKSWEDTQEWIQKNILDIFTDPEIKNDAYKALLEMFNFQSLLKSDDIELAAYKEQLLSFVDYIKSLGLDKEVEDQLLKMFNIDLELDVSLEGEDSLLKDGSLGKEIDTMIKHVQELTDNKFNDKILTLSYSDLQIINSDKFNVDGSTISTWKQLQKEIKEAKILMTEDFTTDNFADYAESISSISSNISTYKEALESLESGTFTLSDFMSLTEQFPDLADGVDASSKSFKGLSTNLRKAIRNSPDDLVDELKDLREQLVLAGKSTTSIDQLITSIENMPIDAVSSLSDEYITLADSINEAKVAQTELQEAMSENPNEGFETRGDAINKMKELMEEGKIGSESELWSIAEAFGFTYDSAKTINENADALAKFIAARQQWYAQDEDGNYTFDGTESFLNDVEKAIQSEEFKRQLNQQGYENVHIKWKYDESTGKLDFDFDNADWDSIITALSQTKELAGLTSEEFYDLLIQTGQFFDINWQDADDLVYYLQQINKGTESAAENFGATKNAVTSFLESDGYSTDLLELTVDDDEFKKLPEDVQKVLEEYYELKKKFEEDPLSISWQLDKNEGKKLTKESIESLSQLTTILQENKSGTVFIDYTQLENAAREAGYTEEAIDDMIAKIKEYNNVCGIETSEEDPLGLVGLQADAKKTEQYLTALQFKFEAVKNSDNTISYKIDVGSVVDALVAQGWNATDIQAYLTTLENSGTYSFTLDGAKINVNDTEAQEKINGLIADKEKLSTGETTEYTVIGTGEATVDRIKTMWDNMPTSKSTIYTAYENTYKTTYNRNKSGTRVNGTAHASGTAYKNGSWGAPKTETALVGELGPELLVRNGHWSTVGQNGAEFTQVKKGDIIFNHKQTEQLLKNGYVTGRGKAYADGTAYASGGGTFSTYSFNDSGYTKYDVNDKVLEKYEDTSSSISNAADSLSSAADNISDSSDEFREVFDWIEVRLEEINDNIDLRSARLENEIGYKDQNKTVDKIIDLNQKLYDNLIAGSNKYYAYANKLLSKVPEEYRAAAQDGTIAIETFVGEADEKTLEAIQEYREWVQKGDEAAQQAEETLTEISTLAKQAIDNVATDFGNKNSIRDSKIEQLDAHNALLETTQGSESAAIYQEMIKQNNKNISTLEKQRDEMQAELDKRVESGQIKKYSQDWYDAVNDIAAVDTEIIELKTDTENYQDAINELHWENFDNLMSQYESVSDEAENLIDILSNKDMVDDSGNWTDEGIATLGLYAQQMENAEMQAKQYEEEIKYLNKNWQKLGYTEEEYLEKLDELKDGQYDAVQAYNDTKDAIVDLNQERIDAIKNGIEEEIEAYEELIDKKKEELDAEKDLHDFQKSVMDQQKDIADIQRQLAALSGDNSASARAKRAQLEAELAEAQAELEETYYDRSVSNQQEALDKELENFQEEKDKEMEALDEYLEDTEQVMTDSMGIVQANADGISKTLGETAKEYGLTINDALTDPWKEGTGAVKEYTEEFGDSASATSDALKEIELNNLASQLEAELGGENAVNTVQENFERYQKAEYIEPKKEEPTPKEEPKKEQEKAIQIGGKINAGNAQIYDYAGDNSGEHQYYYRDPIYTVLNEKNGYLLVRHHSLSSGYTGWFKKSDVKAYAKGSKGVAEDQLALIDELGDELIVRAQNGRLTYLEKGSGVVPADLTSNLMEWGRLDPSIMLDQNRPSVGVHPEIHNTQIQIDNSIAELIHIDHCDQSTLPDVEKIVNNALEKHTQRLNQSLRKYTR